MEHLILGSILLSAIHAAIPNHWIPIVLISKTEKWTISETMIVAGLTALSHTISTILLGIVIGLIGFKLSRQYEYITEVIAPLILIFMGVIYFSLDFKHSHYDHIQKPNDLPKKSKSAIIITLSLAMFLSPCLEIETYYFMAGTFGWIGIAAVSIIYLVVTVSGILMLVLLGSKGIEKYNWHFLGHHEKKVTGGILIALGIFSFFIKL